MTCTYCRQPIKVSVPIRGDYFHDNCHTRWLQESNEEIVMRAVHSARDSRSKGSGQAEKVVSRGV
jgi:hypothetical protein